MNLKILQLKLKLNNMRDSKTLIFDEIQNHYKNYNYKGVVELWENKYKSILNIPTKFWPQNVPTIILESYFSEKGNFESFIELEKLIKISAKLKQLSQNMILTLVLYFFDKGMRYKAYFWVNQYGDIMKLISKNYFSRIMNEFKKELMILRVVNILLFILLLLLIVFMWFFTNNYFVMIITVYSVYIILLLILKMTIKNPLAKDFLITYGIYFGILNLISMIVVPKIKNENIIDFGSISQLPHKE
jgi:hypothetical protein